MGRGSSPAACPPGLGPPQRRFVIDHSATQSDSPRELERNHRSAKVMSTSPTTQPQPLPLTAPVWIGLGLVVLLMASRLWAPGGILSPEPRMQRLSLQVQRHVGG